MNCVLKKVISHPRVRRAASESVPSLMETSRVFMKREPENRAATQINYIKDRDNCKVDGFDTDERGAISVSISR